MLVEPNIMERRIENGNHVLWHLHFSISSVRSTVRVYSISESATAAGLRKGKLGNRRGKLWCLLGITKEE